MRERANVAASRQRRSCCRLAHFELASNAKAADATPTVESVLQCSYLSVQIRQGSPHQFVKALVCVVLQLL